MEPTSPATPSSSRPEELPVIAPIAELEAAPTVPEPAAPAPEDAPVSAPELNVPEAVPAVFGTNPPPPSPEQQSWGVVISIVVIVVMIVVGAFYAWGARIAENQQLAPTGIE